MKKCFILMLCALATFISDGALAAGFEYGPQGVHAVGRGGAFVVSADDPSACYWNPARLALLRGTRLHYSHNFADEHLSFSRSPAQPLDASGKPRGEPVEFPVASEALGFFPLNLSMAASSDFGLQDFTFGLAVLGPSAIGKSRFHDTGDMGATRYSFLEDDIKLLYVTGTAAWRYRQAGRDVASFGVSVQYAMLPSLRYRLVVIGSGGPSNTNHPARTLSDLSADVDVSDLSSITAVIGAWLAPLPWLELAVSSRVAPIRFSAKGEVHMKGTPNSIYKNWKGADVDARLDFLVPRWVKAGARYVYRKESGEVFDVEADFVWEEWSDLQSFKLHFLEDSIQALGTEMRLSEMEFVRNYRDTYSVRLGGQWNVVPDTFTSRLGFFWESAAQPAAYVVTDYPSFERFGLGVGLSYEWRGLELSLAYSHVFQRSVRVEQGTGRVFQQKIQPDDTMAPGYPVNEGEYKSSFDIIAVGLNVDFDELLGVRRQD